MFKHFFTSPHRQPQPTAEKYSAINAKIKAKTEQNNTENKHHRIVFLVYDLFLEDISKVRNFALDFKNKGDKNEEKMKNEE